MDCLGPSRQAHPVRASRPDGAAPDDERTSLPRTGHGVRSGRRDARGPRPADRVRARARRAVPARARAERRARGGAREPAGDLPRHDEEPGGRDRGEGPDHERPPRPHAGLRTRARSPDRPGARRDADARLRLLPPRHRQGGDPRAHPVQGGTAHRRRVDRDAQPPDHRRADRRADRLPRRHGLPDPPPPRVVRRHGVPRRPGRRGHPARRPGSSPSPTRSTR